MIKKLDLGCVTSGAPQESVFGSLLFIIYINDSDIRISSDINKFADDKKIDRVMEVDQDASVSQDELDRLYGGAVK